MLRTHRNAAKIDSDHSSYPLERAIRPKRLAADKPSVVMDNVDPTEDAGGLIEHPADIGGQRNIGLHRDSHTLRSTYSLGRNDGRRLIEIDHHHARANGCERFGACPPNARARPGDQRDLASKLHCDLLDRPDLDADRVGLALDTHDSNHTRNRRLNIVFDLVGFDAIQHIARLNGLPVADHPLDEGALGHRNAKLWNRDGHRHDMCLINEACEATNRE